MSNQVNIKEVIETLCQLLFQHGITKISSEIFRQGKFNKPEATPFLLNLIYQTLKLDELSENKFTVLLFVLNKLDYPRLSQLICINESELSSKELLLVFGFLLGKFKFIENLLLEAENVVAKQILFGTVWDSETEIQNRHEMKEFSLDSLVVLQKKIDFVYRGLTSSTRHYVKMLEKFSKLNKDTILNELNKNTFGVQFRNISLLDLFIQGNLKWQRDFISVVSKQNMLFKLHFKWLKYEVIFWRWMTSVGSPENTQQNISNQMTANERLKLSFVLSNELLYNNVLKYYCKRHDQLSLNRKLPDKDMLLTFLRKHVIFTELDKEKETSLFHKVTKLQNNIKQLQDNNKLWLSHFLHTNYPNIVHIPVPKRQTFF